MYEELYAQNVRLLQYLANRYSVACAYDRAVSTEDLAQAGFFGLIRAAESFDPSAGANWSTWASWHIKREFEKALGRREGHFTRAHSGALSLDLPLAVDDSDSDTLGDLLADDSLPEIDENLMREDVVRAVRAAVDSLQNAEHRQVVRWTKLEGRSVAETAAAMGVPPTRVRSIWTAAKVKLYRNHQLKKLAELDGLTRFHAHKSVGAFNRDWTSTTEAAALWRIEQRERLDSVRPI